MSGSLDPFKPFHRHFTRLHNAATLIKINYTLARQFALLSVTSLLPLPHNPHVRSFLPFSTSPSTLVPPLFLHRTFDHQIARHYWLGNLPLFHPRSRLFALYSRFNLPTSGRQPRWCALDSVMGLKKKKWEINGRKRRSGEGEGQQGG